MKVAASGEFWFVRSVTDVVDVGTGVAVAFPPGTLTVHPAKSANPAISKTRRTNCNLPDMRVSKHGYAIRLPVDRAAYGPCCAAGASKNPPRRSASPGGSGFPTDTNADGRYDDVNSNGRRDFNDVVLHFSRMTWIVANEPFAAFDHNSNDRIDFADVVQLLNNL